MIRVILDGDLQGMDYSDWVNSNIIVPLYRDIKADTYAVLRHLLDANQIGFVHVSNEGSFQSEMLHDDSGNWRPVIILSRANDSARRVGVGEQIMYVLKDSSSNTLIDVTDAVLSKIDDGTPINIIGQESSQTLSIVIVSHNSQMADQLYGFVKIAMMAAEKQYFMESLGYLDILRSTGGDGQDEFINDSGGPRLLATRTLTYSVRTLDFIAGVANVVELIKQTYTGMQVQPDGSAAQTMEL